MKIIKQNYSAGGLIFRQNTNGKVMKQNYNYAKGYNVTFSQTLYLDIPIVIGKTGAFSLILYGFRKSAGGANPAYLRFNGKLLDFFSFPGATTGQTFSINNTTSQQQLYAHGYSYANGVVRYMTSANTMVTFTKQLSEDLTYIRVGLHTNPLGGKFIINNICIFDRAISDNEIMYFKNGGLGNELLNVSGLKHQYPMQQFEIINSAIRFRDITDSANHIAITGLPAGSLEDQLAYANTNLIEKML